MQIKNVILWFIIPFFFTFNSTTVTAKKKKVIEMKIHDVIYYDTFYLIIGVKDNDIYRVISKKETQEVSEGKRISGSDWYQFEVILIKPYGVDVNWKYKCTCAKGALGEYYSVDGLSFVLPYIYSDNRVYYATNTEGLYVKDIKYRSRKDKFHKR